MAVTFGGSGGAGRFDVGSATPLDGLNAGAIMAWIYLNTLASANVGYIYSKGLTTLRQTFQVSVGGLLSVQRARATTSLTATADIAAAFSGIGAANKWLFVACRWDTGAAADTDIRLYLGDLDNPPVEATVYTAQARGSGTPGANAADNAYIGNNADFNRALDGAIATVCISSGQIGIADTKITWRRARRRQQEISPWISWWDLQDPATATDIGGGLNNGTGTGTSYFPHVPLGANKAGSFLVGHTTRQPRTKRMALPRGVVRGFGRV